MSEHFIEENCVSWTHPTVRVVKHSGTGIGRTSVVFTTTTILILHIVVFVSLPSLPLLRFLPGTVYLPPLRVPSLTCSLHGLMYLVTPCLVLAFLNLLIPFEAWFLALLLRY